MAKKGISKFIAKELLYDYVSGNLDEERRAQVQFYLKEDAEIQKEHAHILLALKYLEELKQISLTEPRKAELIRIIDKPKIHIPYKKIGIRAGQAFASLLILFAVYKYFPINPILDYIKQDSNEVKLAEVPKVPQDSAHMLAKNTEDLLSEGSGDSTQEGEEDEVNLSPEEEQKINAQLEKEDTQNTGKYLGDEPEMPPVKPSDYVQETSIQGKISPGIAKITPSPSPTAKPISVAAVTNLPKPEIAKPQTTTVAVEETTPTASPVPSATKASAPVATNNSQRGFVYRSFLSVANKDEAAQRISQKISELNGAKAGSVELGWLKPNGNSYYHFTMSEQNFDIFREYLKSMEEGVNIEKSPHPRVMPAGEVRMILEVRAK